MELMKKTGAPKDGLTSFTHQVCVVLCDTSADIKSKEVHA